MGSMRIGQVSSGKNLVRLDALEEFLHDVNILSSERFLLHASCLVERE